MSEAMAALGKLMAGALTLVDSACGPIEGTITAMPEPCVKRASGRLCVRLLMYVCIVQGRELDLHRLLIRVCVRVYVRVRVRMRVCVYMYMYACSARKTVCNTCTYV